MTAKRFTPPPKRSPAGKRRKSRLRICLHVKRDANGKSEPEALLDGTPLWRFVVRGHLPDGTPKTKTFAAPDWREAEIAASKIADEWARLPQPAPARHTVNDLADLYLAIKKSKGSTMRTSTVLDYERRIDRDIRPMLGNERVEDLTPALITEWMDAYCPYTLKSRTRAHRLGLLSSLLRLAIRRQWITVSPILPEEHRITVLKVGRVEGQVVGDERKAIALRADEVDRVIAALDDGDPAMRMLVAVTARAGFRLREVTHLRVADVAVQPNGAAFITVASGFLCSCVDCRASYSDTDGEIKPSLRLTKAGESRVTPLAVELIAPMREYLGERAARFGDRGPLFPVWRRAKGGHLRPGDMRSAQTIRKVFQVAAKAVGIKGVVFHDLRSTSKTRLLADGGVPAAVDYAIGHRMPGMTQLYAAWADDLDQFYRAVFPSWRATLVLHADAEEQIEQVGEGEVYARSA
jgi:integrase